MRIIVTGLDRDGKSCVLESRDADVDPVTLERPHLEVAFDAVDIPTRSRPPGHGDLRDLGVRQGQTRLLVVTWPPDSDAHMHHTDTVDFDTVLRGSIDLVLDDGVHPLSPGDVVVIPGVDHGWRTGPDGCTMSITLQGTTPPTDSSARHSS